MSTIEEEKKDLGQESFEEIEQSPGSNKQKQETENDSSSCGSGEYIKSNKLIDLKLHMDEFLEQLIQFIKRDNVQDFEKHFSTQQHKLEEFPENNKLQFINELDKNGWNLLHYATALKNEKIINILVNSGANVNIPNNNGWTPLQICIYNNSIENLKILLKSPTLDLKFISTIGSVLHVACYFDRHQALRLLLDLNIDVLLKNDQGQTCIELCKGPECLNILKETNKFNQINDNQTICLPSKPQLIMGMALKKGGKTFKMRDRFLVLNPKDNTFVRYKVISDYPLYPHEIVHLKDITNVQMISKPWYLPSDLFYFEITYSQKQVLACKHESTAKKWVEYIYLASIYAQLEHENQKICHNVGSPLKKNANQLHQQEETTIDLKDVNDPLYNQKENAFRGNIQDGIKKFGKHIQQYVSQIQLGPQMPLDKTCGCKEDHVELNQFNQNTQEEEQAVFFDSFKILKQLGRGAFGRVFLVKKKDTGKIYALKSLEKIPLIVNEQLKYAVTEANVLKTCNHPFILQLHYAFQTPKNLYLVVDYCKGGDLSKYIKLKERFSEQEAIFYITELILAIQHLHEKNVIYRDLKPDNILIGNDGHIKLADFGLSKENVHDISVTKSFCGTPAYLSPEMLVNKGVTKCSDLYGIGAVLYEMLTGQPPYYNEDIDKLYKKISKESLTFPPYLSDKAKNILLKLLDRNPNNRLGSKDRQEIRKDPFFQDVNWDKVLKKQYEPPFQIDFDEDGEEIRELDIANQKAVFTDLDYDETNQNKNRVRLFSFVRK